MPDINPNLVPTIDPGNLFERFANDQSIAIRWLTPNDPVYFETLNRPLADVRLNQLIMAKTIDEFSFNISYLTNFPFITQPQVGDGISVANVSRQLFHDFHVSVPFKWHNLRLGRIYRLNGANNATLGYTGTIRFVFVADEDDVGGTTTALFYVDYLIESDLDYQPARVQIATSSTVAGMTPVSASDGESIDGYVILATSELDSSGVPSSASVKQFFDLLVPGASTAYTIVDTTGITGEGEDFNAGTVTHGTGMLTSNAYNLITPHPDPGLELDPTGTFFDADSKQIKNLDDPTALRDAANKNYIDNQVGIVGATFLKRDGSNTFTGSISPLNMSGSRIVNLASPINGGDATSKTYVDVAVAPAIKRDGSVSWLTAGSPFSMSSVRIINLGTPVNGTDATTKNYVDSQISGAVSESLARDGSNTFTGTSNNLRMSGKRITNLGTPQDSSDAVTKSYVDAVTGNVSVALLKDGSNAFSGENGPMDLGGNRIINIGNPQDGTDAVNRQYGVTNYLLLNGTNAMTADINVGGHRIKNLSAPTMNSDGATKKYVDDAINSTIKRDGSTIWEASSSPLNMNQVRIVSVGTPVDTGDAANKLYVDTSIGNITSGYMKLDGSNQFLGTVGPMNLNNNRIISVSDPVNDLDAANKLYVDTAVTSNIGMQLIGSRLLEGPNGSIGRRIIPLSETINNFSVAGRNIDMAPYVNTNEYGIIHTCDQGRVLINGYPLTTGTPLDFSNNPGFFGGGKFIDNNTIEVVCYNPGSGGINKWNVHVILVRSDIP